jgi:hypothetical protein
VFVSVALVAFLAVRLLLLFLSCLILILRNLLRIYLRLTSRLVGYGQMMTSSLPGWLWLGLVVGARVLCLRNLLPATLSRAYQRDVLLLFIYS